MEEIFIKRSYDGFMGNIHEPILSWVDAGCNAGIFSAWLLDRALLSKTDIRCRALLIEPGVCVRTAREFTRMNRIEDSFQVIQACIGDGSPVRFYESKSSTRSSSEIVPTSKERIRIVHSQTLLSLLETFSLQDIDLLKVDIEGAEKHLLADSKILRRFKYGLLEWHAETTSGFSALKWVQEGGGEVLKVISQDGNVQDPLGSKLGMILWKRCH